MPGLRHGEDDITPCRERTRVGTSEPRCERWLVSDEPIVLDGRVERGDLIGQMDECARKAECQARPIIS